MITENLSTLKIHKLTKEQYERELANGNIDETALYLTPEEEIDFSPYATVEQMNGKADSIHSHTIDDVTDLQTTLDTMSNAISGKANSTHTHNVSDITNLESVLNTNLESAKSYTDTELAKKSDSSHTHDDRYYTETEVDTKISGVSSTISTHTGNTTVHITSGERTNWDSAYSHSTSAHAPSNAERNVIVGVQKNGTDLTVDSSTRKVNITVPTTAAEIGAATSGHNHDSAYDAKDSAANALAEAKEYTNTKTSGMATTTVVDSKISSHNTSTTAHSDIRDLISALSTKVNNFLDVDDTTTDELSEILELINNNKGTLESLTSNKVNVSDIVNNLTTASTSKVLSANQGVVLKGLIDALQEAVDGKAASNHNHIYYGVCSTAANTAAKTVTVDNFSLVTGAMVIVKFSNANLVTSPTLNVNSTGAKPICRYGTTAVSNNSATSGWRAGAVQIFVYDGTSWVRDFWENTTYTNQSLGQGYATCSTAEEITEKDGVLSGNYLLTNGGIVAVKFTYAVPTSATLSINSQGAKAIYHRGAAIAAGVIKAGDIATFMYTNNQYHLLTVDRDDNTTITGAATTITSSNLTTNRALVSNGYGKVAASAVTVTELGYLDGVTSAIQTQLDGKAASNHSHTITATATDDDVIVLTGTNGTNKVTFDAKHATSGVAAGTYKSVTVNAYGHVTDGSNPTTLYGYGIIDAYTKNEIDNIVIGKSLEGQTVRPTSTTSVTAGVGAEIFNDYRDRTFSNAVILTGNVASGEYSHAEGQSATASGEGSHAEGGKTTASGNYSHAEGYDTTASGVYSHAEGTGTFTSGMSSHSEGFGTDALGNYSHAEGFSTTASGDYSHAEGSYTTASGDYSHAGGYNTTALKHQFVAGKYNNADTTSIAGVAGVSSADSQSADETLFVIGYGTSTAAGNAFRISANGKCRGVSTFTASGADFAELFEWEDGNFNNEDRRGLFVALEGEKIKLANNGDDFIGVISGAEAFLGNSASEEWQGKYLTDVFGTRLTQTIEIPEKIDDVTNEVITPAHTVTQYVLNPDYNPNEKYIMRENRKEWGTVGLLGQVVVIDDGTCVVGGYVKPSLNGVGTASNSGYRVIKRIDETHIKVLVK